jgi:ring-1,2-phenylacetyl-CoA epoxidase subunit PaaE
VFGRHPRRIILPRGAGPAARWQQRPAQAPRWVRVQDIIQEAADALTLVLVPDDDRPLRFRAGQYLTHIFEIGEREERRVYSLSSAEGGALACTVRVLPDGRVSQFIANHLRAGDRYRVLGPGGDFTLDAQHRGPLVLLGAGSGMTPVISLVETALTADPQRSVRVVDVQHDAGHALFHARLRALAQHCPGLSWHSVVTAEQGWPDATRLAQLLQPAADAQVYLCGPQGLMDEAESGLNAAGFDSARIRRERFVAAPQHRARPTEPVPIVFKRSAHSVEQQPGESLLDAGLRAGLKLEFSCTVGGCGHCKVRVLDGEVLLEEPNCLSPEERAAGYTLACSACAATPVTIDA